MATTLSLKILARDGYTCAYCGRKGSAKVKLEIDHVTPESWGGPTTANNLVTSCARCNNRKSDLNLKLYMAYLRERFGTDTAPIAARVKAALRKKV